MEFIGLDKKFYKWIKLDEVDVDLDDFFRYIEDEVWELILGVY